MVVFAATVGLIARHPQGNPASPTGTAPCRISGRITGAGTALPGVAITVRRDDAVHGATSTGIDGTYRLTLPEGTYRATFELAGFVRVDREIAITRTACAPAVDVTLSLTPRVNAAGANAVARGRGARGGGVAPAAGAGPGAGRGFQSLDVSADAAGEAALDLANSEPNSGGPVLLLPPGFSSEASADAIAVTGDSARVDRGVLNDCLEALARGDIPPFVAEAAAQFGISPEELAGRIGQAGRGGRGGAAAGQGPGRGGAGRGGQGDFVLGGRGGRGARITATADYTFGGSALDASPYQLRSDAPRGRAAVHAAEFRRHDRRAAADPGTLQRHQSKHVHAHLQRRTRQLAVRSVRHGPDRRDARR